MISNKTTLITHIYNEEYLLPFWLNHHRNMFDNLIVIDYDSTDNSIEICKTIWSGCEIIKSRNKYFGAIDIDREVMDIENNIEGIKVVLNTTEFLFCNTEIKDLFSNVTNAMSYAIDCVSPYSLNNYNVNNNYELFKELLNSEMVYHKDRFKRYLHNYQNGNYNIGRHSSNNPSVETNLLHLVWFGYYPMNDNLLKRKLQIQSKIPESDKNCGFGFHHLFTKEKMLSICNEKVNTGIQLKQYNPELYNLLSNLLSKPFPEFLTILPEINK